MSGQNCIQGFCTGSIAHLVERAGVEQNPTELNHLSRVLGDINSMLVARGCDVDHDISVDLQGRALLGGHGRESGENIELDAEATNVSQAMFE